jgi:hypothetical protein
VAPELESAAIAYTEAREIAYSAWEAAGRVPSLAEYKAMSIMVQAAEIMLTHVGLVDPFECGECDACQANAEARREQAQAAVDADPDLGPGAAPAHDAVRLSDVEDAEARRLLADLGGAPE